MNEVIAVGIYPHVVKVVNLEANVGWNPRRLNWREIDAFHNSTWDRICNISAHGDDISRVKFVGEASIRCLERAYIAQIPVPVPTSRTFSNIVSRAYWIPVIHTCGFLIGAEYNSPPRRRVQKW
jgi:hypothetical protein